MLSYFSSLNCFILSFLSSTMQTRSKAIPHSDDLKNMKRPQACSSKQICIPHIRTSVPWFVQLKDSLYAKYLLLLHKWISCLICFQYWSCVWLQPKKTNSMPSFLRCFVCSGHRLIIRSTQGEALVKLDRNFSTKQVFYCGKVTIQRNKTFCRNIER